MTYLPCIALAMTLISYQNVRQASTHTHTHTQYTAYIPADESEGLSCLCRMLFVAAAADTDSATSRLSR